MTTTLEPGSTDIMFCLYDSDDDGQPDIIDDDDDDGTPDNEDAFPTDSNETNDNDGDGIGDVQMRTRMAMGCLTR